MIKDLWYGLSWLIWREADLTSQEQNWSFSRETVILEWWGRKPRDAGKKAEKARDGLPWSLWGSADFQPLELWENSILSLSATKFMVNFYSSLGRWVLDTIPFIFTDVNPKITSYYPSCLVIAYTVKLGLRNKSFSEKDLTHSSITQMIDLSFKD